MARELNQKLPSRSCPEFEERLVLLAAGELEGDERAVVEAHAAACAHCATRLDEERSLLSALLSAERAEPSAGLLASCRAGLDDALDVLEQKRERGWLGAFRPVRSLVTYPALSAVLLIALGFSAGVLAPHLFLPSTGGSAVATNPATAPSLDVKSSPHIADLRSADVAGINWTPAGNNGLPRVELQLKTEQPVLVQGTVRDENVKRLLLGVLNAGGRFNPDTRLTCVELLQACSNDPDVRQALCQAIHTDQNPAVRLKALEALEGAEPQDLVRQTVLDALADDQNPGVRVEAMNTLRAMVESGHLSPDAKLVGVLRERMKKDPNNYIRLQSAAALDDFGPRQKF